MIKEFKINDIFGTMKTNSKINKKDSKIVKKK